MEDLVAVGAADFMVADEEAILHVVVVTEAAMVTVAVAGDSTPISATANTDAPVYITPTLMLSFYCSGNNYRGRSWDDIYNR